MRWFLRRLGFYVFAIWVALTITFLLPRVMPGDPIGGILQRLSPAQIQSNPGIIKTYQALLGGGNQSIWSAYWPRSRSARPDRAICSRSAAPSKRSRG